MSLAATPTTEDVRPADRHTDDTDLIRRAQAGDREAFGALYVQHHAGVRACVAHALSDYPSDVDDVTAAVFLRALEQIDRYQDRGRPFAAWLNEIVRWFVREHRKWRSRRREEALAAPDSGNSPHAKLTMPGLSPEDAVVLRRDLVAVLNALGPRRRLALVLREWAGWPNGDIADVLHISRHAADALISQARKRAREIASRQPRRAAAVSAAARRAA